MDALQADPIADRLMVAYFYGVSFRSVVEVALVAALLVLFIITLASIRWQRLHRPAVLLTLILSLFVAGYEMWRYKNYTTQVNPVVVTYLSYTESRALAMKENNDKALKQLDDYMRLLDTYLHQGEK